MDAITYTKARAHFAETMNRVCDDHAPLIITRQKEKPVVMISLEDYNALEETLHLLKSPKNAARLNKALADLHQGKISKKKLMD